jgi:NADH dehydrogenase
VAAHANRAGVKRLLHISGIGADASSDSAYIRSRGQGEAAVLTMFPSATIIRPAVMFASDDSFLIPLTKTLRTFPVFPLFGRGQTKLQPAYAEDVAEAAVRTLTRPERGGTVYELGGRDVLTYEELLRRVAKALALKRVLVPIPFGIWKMLVTAAKVVPGFPITKSQVELMAIDNVADPKLPGFEVLGIAPRGITQEIESLSV